MIKFDFVHSLKVKDESLEVYEEEGRQRLEAVVFLDSLDLALAEIAEIVADKLGLSVLIQTLLQIPLVFYFHRQNVEIFNSFLLVEAFLAVYHVNHLSPKIIPDQPMVIGAFEPHLESVQQLVQKLISVVLLPDVYRFSVVVEVVEAKLLRNKVDPLAEGKVVDDPLK